VSLAHNPSLENEIEKTKTKKKSDNEKREKCQNNNQTSEMDNKIKSFNYYRVGRYNYIMLPKYPR
jgi:hypothetical protein